VSTNAPTNPNDLIATFIRILRDLLVAITHTYPKFTIPQSALDAMCGHIEHLLRELADASANAPVPVAVPDQTPQPTVPPFSAPPKARVEPALPTIRHRAARNPPILRLILGANLLTTRSKIPFLPAAYKLAYNVTI
jgi:hypothetical protein